MAPRANPGHGPRLWQGERVTSLEAPEQEPCLQASRLGERRCLDLAVQPSQGLVLRAHEASICQNRHSRKWPPNYAFERPVKRLTSTRGQRAIQFAPSARLKRLRPAAQRER